MKQLFFYILPLFALLTGCNADHEDGYIPSPSGSGSVQVPFNVSMPAHLPKTYALDENDENEVKTIDILAFKVNGNEETFAYRAQAAEGSIVDDGVNNKKKFVVTLFKDGSQAYRFVAVANAKEQLDNTFPGGITVGTSKDAVMEQLKLTGINKWNVDNGTQGYLPIPMWGETLNNIVIQDNTTITDLKLLRMVAKINVKVDTSIPENIFALSSVSLYNYYSAGRIAPDADNLVSGSRSSVDKPTVTGTSTKGPIDYDGSGIVTNNSIINNIYTFESVVPKTSSEVDMSKVTTLVVGGKYNNSSTVTYYRVDIVNGQNYLDILRNHLYTINITKVKSAGYSTKEEAFNSRPINIEAEVVVWDDASIGDIEFDGQFMLGVSQGIFELSKNRYIATSQGNTVSISTDYKSIDGTVDGWAVSSIKDANGNAITDWLKTSVSSGAANVTTDMKLLLTDNNSGAERIGFINITAGRLNYVIQVKQSIIPELSLSIVDVYGNQVTELIFESQFPDVYNNIQEFTVNWVPADRECDITTTGLGTIPFSFFVDSNTSNISTLTKTTAGGTGQQVFKVRPVPLTQAEINTNPLIEKASKVEFLITNGLSFTAKSIYIRQIHYGLQAVLNDYYVLDGTQQSIVLKSNSTWKIRSVVDTQNLLVGFDMNQSGGYNVQNGDLLLFTLRKISAATDLNASITFTFYDPSAKYVNDVSVTINPVACGMGGIAAPLKIGNNTYKTHMYGDKCWMVENSREGSSFANYFGSPIAGTTTYNSSYYSPNSANGQHYYSYTSTTACPEGWHIPTLDEGTALMNIVNTDIFGEDGTKGAQWWAGPAISGSSSTNIDATLTGGAFNNSSGTPAYYIWREWSQGGYWWMGRYVLKGTTSNLSNGGDYATRAFFTIRCVQD